MTTNTNAGMSIIELVVATAVAGILIVALTILGGRLTTVTRENIERGRTTEDSRLALERMSEVLRNAQYVDLDGNGTIDEPSESWLQTGRDFEVKVFSNTDTDAAPELVRYFIDPSEPTALQRSIIQLSDSNQVVPETEKVTIITRSARNLAQSQPLFNYRTAGSFTTSPLPLPLSSTDLARVQQIELQLVVDTNTRIFPGATTVSTVVTPRTNPCPPGACIVPTPPPGAPTADIKARVNFSDTPSNGPITISYNTAAYISWTSTNTTSCTVATPNWTGTSHTGQSTGNLTSTRTYTITCTGAGGSSAPDSVTVQVSPPTPTPTPVPTPTPAPAPTPTPPPGAPTADIKARVNFSDTPSNGPITISYNTAAYISWTSTNTTSCTVATPNWTGTSHTGQSTGNLTSTRTYTITCTGAGGTATDSITVNVTAPSAPTVDLKANNSDTPPAIPYNTAATLSWTSTNATSCAAVGGWSGSKTTSGSQSTDNLTTTTTYTLNCTGTGGTATDSITVNVTAPSAPTVDLKANSSDGPISVAYNATVTLSWISTNATTCTASGGWSGSKSPSGSEISSTITTSKTYTLNCTGSGGSATDSVTVNILPPTVDLKANNSDTPPAIPYNTAATLSWTSTNATSCAAVGGWTISTSTSGSKSTGDLTATRSYTMNCTGPGGTASDSVTVTVFGPPSIVLKGNNLDGPISVAYGSPVTISWTGQNLSSCTASGDWAGSKSPTSGSVAMGNLTTDKSYVLSCRKNGSSSGPYDVTDRVDVDVGPAPPPPTVDLKANGVGGTLKIKSGTAVTLNWTTTNATTCTASNGWTGSKATSGSESRGTVTSDKTYSLTCTGPAGASASDTVVVDVVPAPTVDLLINGGNGPHYMAATCGSHGHTLSWTSANSPDSCTASGDWSGTKATAGSEVLSGNPSRTYTLTCTNVGGSSSDSVQILQGAAGSCP